MEKIAFYRSFLGVLFRVKILLKFKKTTSYGSVQNWYVVKLFGIKFEVNERDLIIEKKNENKSNNLILLKNYK